MLMEQAHLWIRSYRAGGATKYHRQEGKGARSAAAGSASDLEVSSVSSGLVSSAAAGSASGLV